MANILIAYFSRNGKNYVNGSIQNLPVGNTQVVAEMVEELTGGEKFQIKPVKSYSSDYHACTEEAQQELRAGARPELTAHVKNMDTFDTVILGYPNWWGTMPMPVWTFLEEYEFKNKTILPFCTHEGSGMGRSEQDIAKLCSGAVIGKGLAIHGTSVKSAGPAVKAWLEQVIAII